MKKCYKCQEIKNDEEFSKSKRYKSGLNDLCKKCKKEDNVRDKDKIKEYYHKNIDRSKEYRVANKEKYLEYNKINSKNYYKDPINKEKKRKYTKEYGKVPENILRKKQKIKEWKINNPNYHNEYAKKRYERDIIFKIKSNLRSRFFHAVKGKAKQKSVISLIGCSVEQFKENIEFQFKPEMTWENHGIIWEVDHIVGCCNFDFSDFENHKLCFHYSNFQPLFKTTEIARSLGYYDIQGNRNKPKLT